MQLEVVCWDARLRICSYKYFNPGKFTGICADTLKTRPHTLHPAIQIISGLCVSSHWSPFHCKMSTGSSLPLQWQGLIFQVIGSRQWGLGKKGKPWNNAVWLWLVVNRLWKMGNKFLRGILHSSSPCTSCVVSIIAKDPQTVEWKSRMSMGGEKKACSHMKHIYVQVKPSECFILCFPWHPLITDCFWYTVKAIKANKLEWMGFVSTFGKEILWS